LAQAALNKPCKDKSELAGFYMSRAAALSKTRLFVISCIAVMESCREGLT